MKMRMMYLTFIVLLLKISTISPKEIKASQVNKDVDVIGAKNKKPVVHTKLPVEIKACNEVIIFSGKYITDLRDYRKKSKTAWFTVSAYTFNIYKNKDANTLIKSVDIGNFKKKPDILKGEKNCIIVDGGVDTDMTICLKSEGVAKNLLKNAEKFYKCRRGDNLMPVPKKTVQALMKLCKMKKAAADKAVFENRAGNKWDAEREKYNHPNGINVPGTVASMVARN